MALLLRGGVGVIKKKLRTGHTAARSQSVALMEDTL